MSQKIPKKYCHSPFIVTPEQIFSARELEILERYGHWMRALMLGELPPSTDAQVHFVECANGREPPSTEFEKAWGKYIARKKWERENPEYVGARGVREADPGWAGHYRAEDQNGGYLLSRQKYEK